MVDEVIPVLDALLTRKQATQALIRAGFPVGPQTLSYQAHLGRGPGYQIFNGYRALYRWSDVLDWAQARLSTPRRPPILQDRSPSRLLRSA